MAIKLIAIDLDGTLLMDDLSVHESTAPAFERAAKAGITIAIATGRAFQSASKIAEQIPFRGPMVCSNGSQTLDDQWRTIGQEFVEPMVQEAVLRFAHAQDIHVSAYGPDGVCTMKDSEWLTKYKTLIRGLDIPILGFEAVLQAALYKIVMICPAEKVSTYREMFASFVERNIAQLTESGPEYLEILPANANKRNGLEKLARHLGLSQDEIAAIGDYRNDLEMLSWVGVSGAVGNALPEVKDIASFVLKSNEEGGVAEFIDRCILINSRG